MRVKWHLEWRGLFEVRTSSQGDSFKVLIDDLFSTRGRVCIFISALHKNWQVLWLSVDVNEDVSPMRTLVAPPM